MTLINPVIESNGYGETPSSTQPINPQNLIQQMIQAGITQWKYKLALKMAKEPCKKDPARCGYYITQAMKALGLNPPPGMQNINYNQASQMEQFMSTYPQQVPKEDNTWKYLLLGGSAIAGVLLVKYLMERG